MPSIQKKIPVRTDEINRLIDEKGLKNFKIAEWLDLSPESPENAGSYFSMMKGGYMPFPREKAGKLAEILGAPVDYICELFALDSQYNYVDTQRQ